MGKPDAPTPPDPKETAAASQGTSIGTAIANTMMGNQNIVTPYGQMTQQQSGSYSFTDPYTGQTYDIPTFTATTSLSPEMQGLFDTSIGNQTTMGNMATDMLGGWQPTTVTAPQYQTSAGLDTSFGSNDYSADRNEYEAAMMARMQPGLDASQTALDASLANQGIGYGAEAFGDAQLVQSQAENDAAMAAILGAGQEQQRMFEMDMAAQTAENQAKQQEFSNFNYGTGQNFTGQTTANTANMNLILQMLGASQPTVPSFTPNSPSPIPTTDVAGLINNSYSQEMQAYQQQMAMWQALVGAAGDVASAGFA